MQFNFIKKFFIESNVHGVGLVFRSRHHLVERLLWIVLICTSIYFASGVCLREWKRYQDNSIVLSLETNHRSWEYLVPGVTMCTDFFDHKRADNFIEKVLNLTKNDSNYPVYKKFIEVVTLTTYGNLQHFHQFHNYSFLNQLDMLQIAKEMRENLLPDAGFNLVITEMGVCFSTTYLHSLQSVTERTMPTISPEGDYCRSTLSIESCIIKVKPPMPVERNDLQNHTVFVHNKDDVLNPTNAFSMNFAPETVKTLEVIINAIVSSSKLKQLSPAQRKCYFPSEIPLKHFNIYTTNLCLISCRIDAAVHLCGCVPFFYRINSTTVPACDILGMECLATKWFPRISASQFGQTCNCLPLCNNFEYKRASVRSKQWYEFLSSIELAIKFPKNRLKRGVVYSADNLLVAFGGAFGFYLGCSFISAVEFIFFLLEILIENIAVLAIRFK